MLILPPCFGLRVSIYDLTLSPRPVTHCRPYHSCWYFYYSCCCCFCCRCRFSALHLRQFEFGIINKYSVYVVLLQTLPTHGDFASVIFAYAVYLYWLLFLAKTPLMPHLQLNTAFWLIDFTIFDCHYSYRVCIFYLYKWHFNFCLLVKCETHLSFLLFSKKCRFF